MTDFTDKLDALQDASRWAATGRMAEARAAVVAAHTEIVDRFKDFQDDYNAVISEDCVGDEKHCTCVPHLRKRINELTAAEETRFQLACEWMNTAKELRARAERAEARAEAAEKLYAVSSGRAAEWRAKAEAAEKERDEVRTLSQCEGPAHICHKLATARAELAQAQQARNAYDSAHKLEAANVLRLSAELARVRDLMGAYGVHLPECDWFASKDSKCTCGLEAALKGDV